MTIQQKFILFLFVFCHALMLILGDCTQDSGCGGCCSFPTLTQGCKCIEEQYLANWEHFSANTDCIKCRPLISVSGCSCVEREFCSTHA